MKYFTCIFLLILISCNDATSPIKGDLYFKAIDLSYPNGMTEEQIVKFEKYLDTVKINPETTDAEKKIINYLTILRKNNLLRSPSIKIKTQDSTIKKIFLSKSEYEKIKPFTLERLRKKGKKLELELNAKELDSNLYFSDEIIEFKEIDGVTPLNK